jgi:hypothetical protein
MRDGICKLCLEYRPLCDSHALPNSLFNYILRKNDGKAVVIADDANTPVQFSSDTWDVELLCVDCERSMNEKYDAYGLAVFRGHEGAALRESEGVRLVRIDRKRLRMFFLSVLWRISVSSHPNYSNIDLPVPWEEDLRSAFHNGRPIHDSRYTVAVYKMRDTTPEGGFSNEDLRGFIMAPFGRRYDSFISVCFPFLGFFVETFFPKVPERFAKRRGVLHGRSPVFLAPYVEVLDVPEVMQLLVRGLEKHRAGLSRVA